MKSNTHLESIVFQLTPTRTRCDLYIIANGKKEKIASGLLNPFIAHLKAAQDRIAEGGYSVLLAPEAHSNATWFTKCTVKSFVRFVSTPEILERVFTIESEIIQIKEAISIQGNNEILINDQYAKLEASNEGKNLACDVDGEEMAIVLYKRGAHELTVSSPLSDKERNSKVQLIDVLETRKAVLKKEQGMAFARAVAAGFDIEHVANLLSFAECFGASRLMSGCLRFMELWKKKHESGQWVEIDAEQAMSNSSTSGIVLSGMTNELNTEARGGDVISETAGSNTNTAGGEPQYHGGQHPWVMPFSPQVGLPMYPVPYYQHYPGFYPPPPYPSSVEDHPSHFQKRQSMDNCNRYNNNNIESDEEERSEECKSAGKKKPTSRVVNNYADDHTQERKRYSRSPKRKGGFESETLSEKETHWDAFQTYLLKSAAESDLLAMENDRCRKSMGDHDPFLAHAKHKDVTDTRGMKMFENNSNKTLPVVKYEPDALSLMPERDIGNRGYDPALNFKMQLAVSQDKNGSTAQKHQLPKPKEGVVRKGRPSKLNININYNYNKNTLEDARARADKLRSYKADLQKMKKEHQEAEKKRLEALKMERQKRISARTTRKQLPASSKFTDSEPGLSSPLQRSKIRPNSVNNLKKDSTSTKLTDRMTRSLSVTKTETNISGSYKAVTRIRRLSELKKINNTTNTKPRSAEHVSKPKISKSSDGPIETKKITSLSSLNPISQKMEATASQLNLNNRAGDADANPIIDKTVVMLQHNKQPSSRTTKEFNSNPITGMNIHEVPFPDKGTISVHPQKHPPASSEVCVEKDGKKYEAPYARVSSFEDQSTRNSHYAKAPRHHQPKFGGNGTEKAYVFANLPESKEGKGGFRRLLKLGKKSHTLAPSVPHPHPRVDTLKSLISKDETSTPKSSRGLFSFQLGGETKSKKTNK